MAIDFDNVQKHLGDFGTFQAFVFAISCVAELFVGIQMLANTFLLNVPKHRCFIPNCDTNSTQYHESFLAFAIPNNTDGSPDSCLRYPFRPGEQSCSIDSFNFNSTVSCADYVWDHGEFQNTVPSEFNIVCNKAGGEVISSSIFMAGVLVGAAINGMVADRYGRKVVMVTCSFVQLVSGVVTAFMPSMVLFTSMRFITATATIGLAQTCFIIAIELIGTSKRIICGNFLTVLFSFGELFLVLAAYYERSWRSLDLAIAVPGIILFTLSWFLPESIRWLIAKGRNAEAKKIILRAAKCNKVYIPEGQMTINGSNSDFQEEKESRSHGPLDLIRTPRLRKWSINIFFCWIVNSIVFYGLSLSAGQLHGDLYTNFLLLALAEIPSTLLVTWALYRCGRRHVLCFVMVFGGITCLTSALLPLSLSWMKTLFAVLGKSSISASFSIIYIYTCEIYPTVLRSTGLGFSSMFSRVGGILAPIISNLNTVYASLPMIIFAAASISSGLLVLALPETHNRSLPETVEETETFGLSNQEIFEKKKFSSIFWRRAEEEEKTLLSSE